MTDGPTSGDRHGTGARRRGTLVRPLPPPDRWRLIAPILDRALDLPVAERAAYLGEACGPDGALRAEVEDLLKADADAAAFLGAPVDLSAVFQGKGGDLETPGAGDLAGSFIGSYRVVREIGRGGMGVVYEAEQQRPRRSVALKVILGGRHVDAETVRMFQRESDSLARLKHPSIAAIYESGCTDEGQHFFAMELVQGRTLSVWLEESGAPGPRREVRHRLDLFRKIAAAVAYAHQRGVIHRDLKPSNILVLNPGSEPEGGTSSGAAAASPDIKVLDFGLARIADPDAEGAPTLTNRTILQGTLSYMSPERVRGGSGEIDVRTDVYSLGVILYRMLCGRLPYALEGVGLTEAARIICEEAPRPLARGAGTSPATGGGPKFDRDLAIIAHKALEKDPARRYQTVAALDEDVGRYLSGQPILARAPSAVYQMRKLVARHKAPFGAAAAGLVALVAVAVITAAEARRIAAERDRANREAETAVRVSSFLTELFKVSDPSEAKGNAIKAREILDQGVKKIGKDLADEPEVQTRLMLTMGNVYSNLGLYKDAAPLLEQAVATRRRLLGEESLDTLASMDGLGYCYVAMDRFAEGERIFTRVLEVRQRLEGDEHPDTLKSLGGLASAYSYEGRYKDAAALRRRIFDAYRRQLGDDDRLTLTYARLLAQSEHSLRQEDEAEALLVPTLEKQRRLAGNNHPDTLGLMTDLANVYRVQGRNAEAESLYREALQGLRRVLGADHPVTLYAMNGLCILYGLEGRYAEEEVLLREMLEGDRRILGENHQNTLTTMDNLACVYMSEDRYPLARALFLETLDRKRRYLGEDHPVTVMTLYNLGALEARRGNHKAALDWLHQAAAHGFSRADDMATDSDLTNLHGDPDFEALLAGLRKRSGK
jgi:serine/threonine protein kinase